MEVFVQDGYAYREALRPQHPSMVGDDELHAAPSDVHNEHMLLGGGHRHDHALVDELCLPVAADEPYFDAGAFLHFPDECRPLLTVRSAAVPNTRT